MSRVRFAALLLTLLAAAGIGLSPTRRVAAQAKPALSVHLGSRPGVPSCDQSLDGRRLLPSDPPPYFAQLIRQGGQRMELSGSAFPPSQDVFFDVIDTGAPLSTLHFPVNGGALGTTTTGAVGTFDCYMLLDVTALFDLSPVVTVVAYPGPWDYVSFAAFYRGAQLRVSAPASFGKNFVPLPDIESEFSVTIGAKLGTECPDPMPNTYPPFPGGNVPVTFRGERFQPGDYVGIEPKSGGDTPNLPVFRQTDGHAITDVTAAADGSFLCWRTIDLKPAPPDRSLYLLFLAVPNGLNPRSEETLLRAPVAVVEVPHSFALPAEGSGGLIGNRSTDPRWWPAAALFLAAIAVGLLRLAKDERRS